MFKFVPLLLLAGMVSAVVVAAPNPAKDGLVSHEATGQTFVVRTLPDRKNPEWWITTGLQVRYTIAGIPGDKYTVELWLGLPDEPVQHSRGPGHFDTKDVTIPGTGTKLTEVKGMFDRRSQDRPPEGIDAPPPPWFELKPGTYSLVGPTVGKVWECRLVVKKNGKTLSDTGYFRIVRPTVVEL